MAFIATKKKKTSGVKKETPKKYCPICEKEKPISTGFYKSASPMFSVDGCVPVCITCVKNYIVNDDGTINKKKLKVMLQRLDKPLYYDDLDAAYNQYKKEHGYLPDEEIAKQGKDIIALYFKNINSLRQNKNKSFHDSEVDDFVHQNSNTVKADREKLLEKYGDDVTEEIVEEVEPKIKLDSNNYKATDEDIRLFGEGYTNSEYRKMRNKYEKLKLNYSLQTNIHQEALATYVRFKVKEEDATARGDVDEAKKWYDAAQNAATSGKLTPKALSAADLQKGMNSVCELVKAVEQATDVVKILPQFKYRPNDSVDFTIMCYINYERKLNGQPEVPYEEVYSFYDKKVQEYVKQNGDPYGIFVNDPTVKNRDTVKTFLKMPDDYDELSGDADE